MYTDRPCFAYLFDLYWVNIGSIVFNPFSVGTAFMYMQTCWIQASRLVAGLRSNLFATQSIITHKNKQNLQVLKRRLQYNLFLENYPAFKGLSTLPLIDVWKLKCTKQLLQCQFSYPASINLFLQTFSKLNVSF